MSTRPVALIGLDYYETITRITHSMRSAVFDQIADEVGLTLPCGRLITHWRQLDRVTWPVSGPRPPFRTMRDIWTELGEQLLGQFGVRGCGNLVADRYIQLHSAVRPTARVLAHLNQLSQQVPLALLSDADAEYLLPSLDRCGLPLTQVQFSEKLRNYKPHIDTFLCLAKRGGEPPQHVLYIGDNPHADIQGAHNAGMRTAWVNRSTGPWPPSLPSPNVELREVTDLGIDDVQLV
jgi:FMN phosphatase YigB (HAD superfamily)